MNSTSSSPSTTTAAASPPPDATSFNRIDLESSLGSMCSKREVQRAGKEEAEQQHRRQQHPSDLSQAGSSSSSPSATTAFIRRRITRTSSKTPFVVVRKDGDANAAAAAAAEHDFGNNDHDNGVMEVDVDVDAVMEDDDDCSVLSSDEAASSFNEVDAKTIQDDPIGFWEAPAMNAAPQQLQPQPPSLNLASLTGTGTGTATNNLSQHFRTVSINGGSINGDDLFEVGSFCDDEEESAAEDVSSQVQSIDMEW